MVIIFRDAVIAGNKQLLLIQSQTKLMKRNQKVSTKHHIKSLRYVSNKLSTPYSLSEDV